MKGLIKKVLQKAGITVMGKTQVERNDAFFHLKKLLYPGKGSVFF